MRALLRIVAIWLTCGTIALAKPSVPREHVVQRGQTLAKIAKRYRIELDDLCRANDLKKSTKLQPGMRLSLSTDDAHSGTSTTQPAKTAARDSQAAKKATKSPPKRRTSSRATTYSQYLAKPTRRGWIHVMGHHGDWRGQLLNRRGKLQPKAAAALSRLLAWPRKDFSMNQRLLTLLAEVSDAFGGRTLRVVSGYRTTSFSSESKHPLGRACDFHVLGVPNTALRDFVRTFDHVGVGYYPNSTFIHLDVRDHDAFWIDYAGPGEPPRSTPNRASHPSKVAATPPTPATDTTATDGDESDRVDPEAAADGQSAHDEAGDQQESTPPPTEASKTGRLNAPPTRHVGISQAPTPSGPEAAGNVAATPAAIPVDI